MPLPPNEHQRVAANLIRACEMHESGIAAKRGELRRRYPDVDEGQVDTMMSYWCMFPPSEDHDPAYFKRWVWLDDQPCTEGESVLIDARLAEYRANPRSAIPWAQLRKELRARQP